MAGGVISAFVWRIWWSLVGLPQKVGGEEVGEGDADDRGDDVLVWRLVERSYPVCIGGELIGCRLGQEEAPRASRLALR